MNRLPIILLVIPLIVVSSCKDKSQADAEGAMPEYLSVHLAHDPGNMHPINNMSSAQQLVYTLTQKSLYKIDMRTMDLMPVLLTEMPELLDDSITYDFHLREDVRWDDGTALTAEDVDFTLKLTMCNLAQNVAFRPVYHSVIDSLILFDDDPHHFQIKMLNPGLSNAYVLGEMSIVQKSFWDKENLSDEIQYKGIKTKKDTYSDQLKTWFESFNQPENGHEPEKLVGLGPYKITEWEKDVQIVCERKDNWWGSEDTSAYNQAYSKKIIFRIMDGEIAVVEAFKRNELDVSYAIGTEALLSLRESDAFNTNYHSKFVDQLAYMYIALNMKPDGVQHKPIFVDRDVRWAVSQGINQEALIDVFLHGHGKRQTSMVSPSKPYYNNDLKPIVYDPHMAHDLLDRAGWLDSDGDYIRDKMIDGEKVNLSFKLNYFAEVETYHDIALMIKDNLEPIGFEVVLNKLEFSEVYGKAVTHDYDAMIGSWEGDASIDNPYQLWSTEAWANQGYNFTGFGDASSDSLILECNAQIDYKEYERLIKKIQHLIYLEQPYIFCYQPMKKMIISKQYENADMYVEKAGVILNNLKPVSAD